ncbi:MAG TPA: AraC family transcriptional regulator [Bacteroidota bacterium]|nr:AraC family transcriptional regulator [Bacteroidota bacterium]
MQLAKCLLHQTDLPIAEIASRTGYTSDVAFNHAFKRNVNQPPVAWRRGEEPLLKESVGDASSMS